PGGQTSVSGNCGNAILPFPLSSFPRAPLSPLRLPLPPWRSRTLTARHEFWNLANFPFPLSPPPFPHALSTLMRQLKPNWTLTFQRTSVKNPETIKPFPLTLPLPLSSRPLFHPYLSPHARQLKPNWTLFYYRTSVKNPETIKPFPPGLRMLTGNPFAGNKQANDLANVEWWCGERGKHGNDFPHQKCPQGDQLIAKINFPVCWDGKNIDSADHRTHVVHIPLNTTCPSSHPVALPRISIKVYYPVSSDLDLTWPKDGVKGSPAVYLSTVQSGGTGSPYEYHSDFINGWDQKVLTRLVTDCINKNKKCLVQEDNV
ncbi:unnamed protein product, partial [Closterium sp. NIES-53]